MRLPGAPMTFQYAYRLGMLRLEQGQSEEAARYLPLIWQTRFGRATAPILGRLSRPRRGMTAVNLGLAALVVGAGLAATWGRVSPAEQRHLVGKHMPADAVDWILANEPGTRPFNTYSWGGYLGLMRPDTPIFIDGRSDIYGSGPIREYAYTIMLEAYPQATLDRYRVDHVPFNTNHTFARWLDEPGLGRGLARPDRLSLGAP